MLTKNQTEKLTPFAIVQNQRNSLAAQLQDLDINYQLAVAAIAELKSKIAELEKPKEEPANPMP